MFEFICLVRRTESHSILRLLVCIFLTTQYACMKKLIIWTFLNLSFLQYNRLYFIQKLSRSIPTRKTWWKPQNRHNIYLQIKLHWIIKIFTMYKMAFEFTQRNWNTSHSQTERTNKKCNVNCYKLTIRT